ncbi:DUF512 domain-containing protein [Clostridium oryzae]|uniref:PDZ domain-containing protein n=1 Tax=Clostridium oryzae TaxID=1450648 RepID=A0A1V4IGQ3_9CLOT|nr:DUF512 domain-containing protein [Clostridium oryzae]OPJ59106.1 hypothetical protein CLORY_34350 [Clostridium oryzae]
MSAKIKKVNAGSIAEELEIQVGDILLNINGNEVRDIIDYQFLMADEYVEVDIQKPDGEIWTYEIEKEYDEKLGVEFEDAMLSKAQRCSNNCVFCFIDQLPPNMRETLYFKDDDSRLSFLQGNFVTLTNMSDDDIDRIVRYKISPINVSVQTTNPELRVNMLHNRFAGNIMVRLKKLAQGNIRMNCQIVSCPGINNGEELIKTVEDLYKLHPAIENVAVVPVGVTKYREGLRKLIIYNEESAKAELENMKKLQQKYIREIGEPFVRLSDEFYILAKETIPEPQFYNNYEQLEDGVGMVRMLRDTVSDTVLDLKDNIKGSFIFVTGTLAQYEMKNIASIIMKKNSKINIEVKAVINNFFGSTITVSGLLTGTDIVNTLKNYEKPGIVVMPSNLLKSGERVLLDDMTVEQMEQLLNRKILISDYTGDNLIELINSNADQI